jgi:purine nucleoside permease
MRLFALLAPATQGFQMRRSRRLSPKAIPLSSSTFWYGELLNRWAHQWVKYYTQGKGNYMIAAMEDSGTLQALTFLKARAGWISSRAGAPTANNYDRPPPARGFPQRIT